MKIAGSGSESGYISQMHGSADSDPDPHQNVMDPQQWCKYVMQAGLQLRVAKTVRTANPFELPSRYKILTPAPFFTREGDYQNQIGQKGAEFLIQNSGLHG
jgi:hypothetical protein